MSAGEIALLATAAAAVITAVGGLLVAIKTARGVGQVHTMVNQQRTDMMRYQADLIAAVRAAGGVVPADQSLAKGPNE
jgi:hypothetical protein